MPEEYHRTNINLYAADVEYLQRKYGHGWTEIVRELVHMHINSDKVAREISQNITKTIDLEALIKEQSDD